VEHRSFTPLVFSATGGMGHEASGVAKGGPKWEFAQPSVIYAQPSLTCAQPSKNA